ncbi:MAG: PAS domain S-box protein, partial [Clostridia bacterium]
MNILNIKNSITKKFLVLFTLVIMIPIVVIYNVVLGYTQSAMEKEIMEKNQVNLDALTKRLEADLTSVVLQLEAVLGPEDHKQLDTDLMFNRAKQSIGKNPLIHSISFIDTRKQIVFEAPFNPTFPSITYEYPDFEKLKWSLHPSVSDMIFNFRDYRAVTVAVPVTMNRYQFEGILVAEISQQYLSDLLGAVTVSQGGFSYMFDRKGKVFASTNESDIGKDFSANPIYTQLFLDRYGVINDVFHDQKSIIAYQPMSEGWGLILGIPEKTAFIPIYKLSLFLRIGFFGILLLALCFIALNMRQIVYPITRLTQISGNYRDRQSLENIRKLKHFHSDDEIGVLMKTILNMGLTNLDKQKLLAEKERYLHDLIEGMPYAIITLDMDGIVTHVNRKFVELSGYSFASVTGKHLLEIPIKHRTEDYVLFQALLSDSMEEEKESYLIDADGQKHIVKIATSKQVNEEGQAKGIIAAIQDISQLKLLEERVKQNEKLAAIGQISTGIAHEIKNPLTILSGASELLLEEVNEPNEHRDEASIRDLAEDIYSVVRRMNGIVNDFLSFAKNKGHTKEPVDLEKMLQEVIRLLRITLNEAKVTVSIRVESAETILNAKKDMLIQAFLNLILNSLEAMPSGGALDIVVQKVQAEDGQWLTVSLHDTGIGIPEQNLAWLFNPFFSTKEKGSGLGLTIA